jgi:hypothetical protein
MSVKSASISEVHKLVAWNIGSEANERLAAILGPDIKYFANVRTGLDQYQWLANSTGWIPLSAISSTDASRSTEVNQRLTEVRAMLRTKLLSQLTEQQCDAILTVPNHDYIFYKIDPDGEIQLLFTGWGFTNKRAEKPIIITDSTHEVKIAFRGTNGEILPNHPFYYNNKSYQTGEDGYLFFGNVKVGSEVTLTCAKTGKAFTFTIDNVTTNYYFDVDFKPTVVINYDVDEDEKKDSDDAGEDKVTDNNIDTEEENNTEEEINTGEDVDKGGETDDDSEDKIEETPPAFQSVVVELRDKNGKIIPGATLKFVNHLGTSEERRTNDQGRVELPESFFTNGKRVMVYPHVEGLKTSPCKLNYVAGNNYYIIRLKDKDYSWLLWLLPLLLFLLLFVRCEHSIEVKTLLPDETPIKNVEVTLQYIEYQLFKNGEFFYTEEHKERTVSLFGGVAYFNDMPCSVFSYIFHPFTKAVVTANRGILYGDTVCNFHYTKKTKVYMQGRAKVRVLDRATRRRIPNAKVAIKYTNPDELTDSVPSIITNANGEAYLPLYDEDSVIEDMLVTKKGYSGSRIYYKKLVEAICDEKYVVEVYLDPPEPCSPNSVDNEDRNMGDHCVRDFDMKQNGGTFLLQFFTDSAPDEIIIYDGASSEIDNSREIFRYRGATNTIYYSHQKEVTFSSRYITVVVNSVEQRPEGTNWGYIINCPE